MISIYTFKMSHLNFPQHSLPIRPTETTVSHTKGTLMSQKEMSSSCVFAVPRQVVRKILAVPQPEGVGAVIRRKSIGRFDLSYFDPFLLLDEYSLTAPAGVPDHPHRGVEVVLYTLQGASTHEDFEGHKGTIEAGDLQWITAGRGIVHCEMPIGTQKGLMLWINLSSEHKKIEPRYQEISSEDIAEATKDGVTVKVIAGEALGTKSPIYTRTPTMYLDFTLTPGSHLQQPTPSNWNSFVYVLEGEGVFGNAENSPTSAHHLLLLGNGEELEAWNKSSKPVRFIFVGGEPIGEPMVQLGPFVMNTQEEIDQTIEDFENCVNGFEKARHWRSQSGISLD